MGSPPDPGGRVPLSLAQIHTISNPWMWLGFVVFVLFATAVDLNLGHRAMTTRAALTWCAVWIVAALLFALGLWHYFGPTPAQEFLAGYVLEKSLSVDNLFVFVLIFSFFRTPPALQHRALVWGIVGAMVLRAAMILAGAALIKLFHPIMAVFGAFLIYTGIKLLFHDDEADPSDSWMIQLLQRKLPLTDDYRGEHFMVSEGGKRVFTRLFLVVLAIEASDVIFAVDSVPAIFGVTTDPFIVFTSNIFAILGLRALFFAIAGAIQQLRYLNYGLSLILAFIGVKMILPFVPGVVQRLGGPVWDEKAFHIDVKLSLLIICGVLAITIGLSLLWRNAPTNGGEGSADEEGDAPPPEKAAAGRAEDEGDGA